jgi:hypothetical protein
MRNLYILLALTMMVSCYTKKRAIEKFCTTDTLEVTFRDTVYTKTIKHDTAFISSVDTLTITKDKLRIKYIKSGDTIYLTGECIGDSIYIEKIVRIPNLVEKPNREKYWVYLLLFIFGVFFTLFITRR